ncbi:hypothetical protein HYV69_04175 [Candidatus Uhrbacteria bacterium]|nr:hypothetical protein [Candidatus Uhrbacteria bacterium]
MFRFFMCVVLVLVPSAASAQVPTREEINGAYEFCDTRFSGTVSAMILARDACKRSVDVKVLQRKQEAGEEGAAKNLEAMQAQLKQIQSELKLAQAKPAEPTAPAGPSSDPAPQPQPPQGPSLPAFVGGVPFGVIDTPGQLAATTRDVEGIDRLWVQSLLDGVRYFRRGANQVRVVVRKNGVVVPVAQPDPSVPFDEFYGDINNDGQPDSRPYKGVDTSKVDDVYISNVGPRDVIELVYLVPTGRLVTIAGLSQQILWGRPVRTKLDRLSDSGRWKMSATTAVALR